MILVLYFFISCLQKTTSEQKAVPVQQNFQILMEASQEYRNKPTFVLFYDLLLKTNICTSQKRVFFTKTIKMKFKENFTLAHSYSSWASILGRDFGRRVVLQRYYWLAFARIKKQRFINSSTWCGFFMSKKDGIATFTLLFYEIILIKTR